MKSRQASVKRAGAIHSHSMRMVPVLLAHLAFLALPGHSQSGVPLAKQRVVVVGQKTYFLTSRLKSILVGDFFYNYDHHQNGSPESAIATLTRLGQQEGWTIDLTKDGNTVTAERLSGHQVFFANYISSWASKTAFPIANKAALQDFVENRGGGLFLMHSSGDSRATSNWDWFYQTVQPVHSQSFEPNWYTASLAIPSPSKVHPILEGVSFQGRDTLPFIREQWPQFDQTLTQARPDATVLLAMDGSQCLSGNLPVPCSTSFGFDYNAPGGYPQAWTFPDKKGQVGFFGLAHDMTTMRSMTEPVWDRFFRQFLYYVAGYDTLTAEPPTGAMGRAQPDLNLDPMGITFYSGDQAGVFISRPGGHTVTLLDMAGHKIREIRGNKQPIGYDVGTDLRGAGRGVFILRVAMSGGAVRSKRFFAN